MSLALKLERTVVTPLQPFAAVDSSSRYRPRQRRRDVVVAATAATADLGQRAGAAAGEEAGGDRQVIWPLRERRETRMTLAMITRVRAPETTAVARQFAEINPLD